MPRIYYESSSLTVIREYTRHEEVAEFGVLTSIVINHSHNYKFLTIGFKIVIFEKNTSQYLRFSILMH